MNKIVVLGPTAGRRYQAMAEAAGRQGIADCTTISYAAFADNPNQFAQAITPRTWVRFESPDEDPYAFAALYRAGATRAETEGYAVLVGPTLDEALTNAGQLGSPAQLCFGMGVLLDKAAKITQEKGGTLSTTPSDVTLSYDKSACAIFLKKKGIAVPDMLEPPTSFDDFIRIMNEAPQRRVFLKLRYGSGALGALAVAAGPRGQIVAYTALVLSDDGRIMASKKVRRLSDHAVIAEMVNAIIPLGVHLDCWVPKAGIEGKSCDLRVVAIRGAAPFCVLRLSDGPITNLHLDATRADADVLWQRLSDDARQAILKTAESTLAAFPETQMQALDIAVLNDYRRHVVLEVNAFGDHLRRITHDGLTPQDVQIQQMQKVMRDAAA